MGCGQSQVGIAPRSDDSSIRPTDEPGSVPGTPTKVSINRPRSKTIKVKENNTPVGSPVLLKVWKKHLSFFTWTTEALLLQYFYTQERKLKYNARSLI